MDNNILELSKSILKFRTATKLKSNQTKVNGGEHSLLLLLANDDNQYTLLDLTKYFECSKPYVTKLVQSLQDKGLVNKVTSTLDSRCKYVELTDAGKKLTDKSMDEYMLVVEKLYDKLGAKKVERLEKLLIESTKILSTDNKKKQ